jgi:heme exporter protein D
MNFDSFQAFLEMGGHGAYVWWSYAAGLGVLGYNLLRPLRVRRRVLDALRLSAAQPLLRRSAAQPPGKER